MSPPPPTESQGVEIGQIGPLGRFELEAVLVDGESLAGRLDRRAELQIMKGVFGVGRLADQQVLRNAKFADCVPNPNVPDGEVGKVGIEIAVLGPPGAV